MKYKLIKLLPFENSPKIGYISSPNPLVEDKTHYWNRNWFNPENYPEFWELVVEKDYEILSILLQPSDKHQIHNVSEYKNTGYIEALLNCNSNKIHSVKRLSDSEIFTIGDKVIGYNNFITKIKTIDLVGEVSLNIGTDKHEGFSLKNLKKAKQPLFTTEDGVDIYEGDTIYGINNDWKVFSHYTDLQNKVKSWGIKPIFSTTKKAEEYILLNKPCLSYDDVQEYLKVKDCNKVLDLVQSKIKQSV